MANIAAMSQIDTTALRALWAATSPLEHETAMLRAISLAAEREADWSDAAAVETLIAGAAQDDDARLTDAALQARADSLRA